jgi:DsbC/DsbD-like thiol-disulfide interchange protein
MNLQLRAAGILPLLAAVAAIGTAATDTAAADASPWDNDLRSAARLIAARVRHDHGTASFRAGIQIKLQPGWKTYWRYPGDSGVPPAFDFSASDNVKTVTVSYPAPMRFDDGAGGIAIGYKDEVVLPVRFVPNDSAKPVTLRLKLDYAVCEKLCVPAKADLTLALTGADGAQEPVIAAAEAKVPVQAALGDRSTPAIRAVRREAARHRGCGGAGRRGRVAVRRGPHAGLGAAAARADCRRGARTAALCLQARWLAHGSQARGRHAPADGRGGRAGGRGGVPARLARRTRPFSDTIFSENRVSLFGIML